MHSSLAPHLHGECLHVIEMLHACHEEVNNGEGQMRLIILKSYI